MQYVYKSPSESACKKATEYIIKWYGVDAVCAKVENESNWAIFVNMNSTIFTKDSFDGFCSAFLAIETLGL